MSDIARRLSLLRRDLHELKAQFAPGTGWVACNPEDFADLVQRVLDRDQARIDGGATSTSLPMLRRDTA